MTGRTDRAGWPVRVSGPEVMMLAVVLAELAGVCWLALAVCRWLAAGLLN